MNWSRIAASALGIAVILGAFGAHGLKGRIDTYAMDLYQKAVFYHFIHALGMLVTSTLPKSGALSSKSAARICTLFAAGIVLFSGSLYLLALSGVTVLGAITPIGGLAFIVAWFLLAWSLPSS